MKFIRREPGFLLRLKEDEKLYSMKDTIQLYGAIMYDIIKCYMHNPLCSNHYLYNHNPLCSNSTLYTWYSICMYI